MSVVNTQVGWVPLATIVVQADDPSVAIPFVNTGPYRTVRISLQTVGSEDAYGATANDTGPTAVNADAGAPEPTVVFLSAEALPYHLWAVGPSNVQVQVFGCLDGEQPDLAI